MFEIDTQNGDTPNDAIYTGAPWDTFGANVLTGAQTAISSNFDSYERREPAVGTPIFPDTGNPYNRITPPTPFTAEDRRKASENN